MAPLDGVAVVVAVASSLGGTVGVAFALRRSPSVTVFRVAVVGLAGWALLATTAFVWLIVGGVGAVARAATAPASLVAPAAAPVWILGATGAFVVFVAAFLLSQSVDRGLLQLLRPRPVAWPSGLPVPTPCPRLLAFDSPRPDALTFTLLVPSWKARWRREDVILVSESLLAALAPEEWEAVVAHEVGHVAELDGRYLTFLRTFARMMRWDPVVAALVRSLNRREEFRADLDAVAQTGRPRALARAIYKATRLVPARRGALAGLLGPGGRAGQRQAAERIRRLLDLAESGRYREEPGA